MKFAIKLLLSAVILLICCNLISSLKTKIGLGTSVKSGMYLNSSFKLSAQKHKKVVKANNNSSEMNKMKVRSNILFQGWLKYYKAPDEETSKKPKGFFKNQLYLKDSRRTRAAGEV